MLWECPDIPYHLGDCASMAGGCECREPEGSVVGLSVWNKLETIWSKTWEIAENKLLEICEIQISDVQISDFGVSIINVHLCQYLSILRFEEISGFHIVPDMRLEERDVNLHCLPKDRYIYI